MLISALIAIECGNRIIAPRVSKLVFSKCILMFLVLGGLLMTTSKTVVTKYVAVGSAVALIVFSILWYVNQTRIDSAVVVADGEQHEARRSKKVDKKMVELTSQQQHNKPPSTLQDSV
jgi:hypothetical protein